ncbi:hypothetical protein G6L74_06050 [Agrobacterium tumefaciens]|uniref:hypothetical protein n=1 Tax=Agrobacterium tumefaciens TaxID=358 RepID=UPI001571732F|nr:hypothetical protein [Agrobacterium tumefaciens]
MIDVFTSSVSHPGVIALVFILACAAVTLTAAILLRPTRKRLLSLVTELCDEGKLTHADRAWLRVEIKRSKGSHLLIAAPFAPFAILGALAVAAYEGWVEDHDDERISELEKEIDRLHAEQVVESEGVDPRTGLYWKDARHSEIRDLSLTLEIWNNPLAMMWILFWLVVASPLMVLAYLASGSLKPFVVNVWEPLREPVLAALETVRMRNKASHC